MTDSNPNSPNDPPPRDANTGLWMAIAVVVLLVLGGLVYSFSNPSGESTVSLPSDTTGSGSRVAPPPPAPER